MVYIVITTVSHRAHWLLSVTRAQVLSARLRLISADAIDNGQNKKALHIADKIIKKQEHLFCAKVHSISDFTNIL